MRMRSLLKGAGLVAAAAALIVLVTLAGLLAFVAYNTSTGRDWSAPVGEVSRALTWDGTAYVFTGEDLLEDDRWAMLLDESGRVVWSLRKPADVPETYTLTDVASFTRWYLRDYPVQCRVRDDGLLVVGAPKGSVWKHGMAMDMDTLFQVPAWFAALFLLARGCVLGLAYRVLRRWFRQGQQVRDAARSGWINGVSHDIRTPLAMVMGTAAQLEADPTLPPERRKQAAVICRQSQAIRDLVNDLNLTMRLDCAMQALRKELLQPAAFLRQTAADFLNSGMAEGYPLEMELPETPLPGGRLPAAAGGKQSADQLRPAQCPGLSHPHGGPGGGGLSGALGGERRRGQHPGHGPVPAAPAGAGRRRRPRHGTEAGEPDRRRPRRGGPVLRRRCLPL